MTYPKYATLADIPLTPGRVEYYAANGLARLGRIGLDGKYIEDALWATEFPPLRDNLDALTAFVRALCGDPLDELREWGTCGTWKLSGPGYRASFETPTLYVSLSAPTRAEAVAKLVAAVKAVMG